MKYSQTPEIATVNLVLMLRRCQFISKSDLLLFLVNSSTETKIFETLIKIVATLTKQIY